jgi:two-component system, OmpR family, phosphate regulon sensor histidine kinase PhoR
VPQEAAPREAASEGAPPEGPAREPWVRPLTPRRSAWLGAAVATGFALLGAAWEGGPSPRLILVCLAGLLFGGLAGRLRRRPAPVAPPPAAAAALSAAEALLSNIPDPVIVVDRRVLVAQANEAARALLPAIRVGEPLSFALRAPAVLDAVAAVLRSGEPLRVEYVQRGAAERAFEVQVGPLRAAEETGRGSRSVVVFLRDLTSARRLEHMRVDFVANASHELRTPLATLLGFIETLQGPARDDPPARERFLGIMREQALRMTRLIDDLLSLSRIELHAHVPPTGTVDAAALTQEMVDTLSPLAAERGVVIAVAEPQGDCRVRGDRDELLRVFENLIENAVKYGEAGGRVEVAAAREGGRVAVSVRDHGPGIAPEHLPRLTERFYRVDVAESRQKGGTGLGLAIVKHIVARHHGRLAIESRPGEGATFKVLLPARAEG